ncbi:MAG: hypothetical protein BGO43_09665 [Gammaproteobacteria bacterium 39-13]|nr:MAG: hypothetical protein BGO43_09665 [Gammaproteobacteria bacterium 39-13]
MQRSMMFRSGMISKQQIQFIWGSKIDVYLQRKVSDTLKSHYEPNKPTFMFNDAAMLQTLMPELSNLSCQILNV